MAVANADYCLISVEVGSYGLPSDPNVFKIWTFRKLLKSNKLNIPDPELCPVMLKDYPCYLGFWMTRLSPYQNMCYGHNPTKL